jgi:hypothetical protein
MFTDGRDAASLFVGADRRCFGIEQSIFAAPHTPRIHLRLVWS